MYIGLVLMIYTHSVRLFLFLAFEVQLLQKLDVCPTGKKERARKYDNINEQEFNEHTHTKTAKRLNNDNQPTHEYFMHLMLHRQIAPKIM